MYKSREIHEIKNTQNNWSHLDAFYTKAECFWWANSLPPLHISRFCDCACVVFFFCWLTRVNFYHLLVHILKSNNLFIIRGLKYFDMDFKEWEFKSLVQQWMNALTTPNRILRVAVYEVVHHHNKNARVTANRHSTDVTSNNHKET